MKCFRIWYYYSVYCSRMLYSISLYVCIFSAYSTLKRYFPSCLWRKNQRKISALNKKREAIALRMWNWMVDVILYESETCYICADCIVNKPISHFVCIDQRAQCDGCGTKLIGRFHHHIYHIARAHIQYSFLHIACVWTIESINQFHILELKEGKKRKKISECERHVGS